MIFKKMNNSNFFLWTYYFMCCYSLENNHKKNKIMDYVDKIEIYVVMNFFLRFYISSHTWMTKPIFTYKVLTFF
jgi:hypothetical protein